MIQSRGGLSREMSQLFTPEGHPLFGAFPIRDAEGKPMCNSVGEPFALRFGLFRQFTLHPKLHDSNESRPLPVPELTELVRDGMSLLYQLPANVAVSLWRNWQSGFSRDRSPSEGLWLDALFEFSWQGQPGDPLYAKRYAWLGSVSIELVGKGLFPRLPDEEILPLEVPIPHENGYPMAYYSRLPDLARASVAAIDEILERARTGATTIQSGDSRTSKNEETMPTQRFNLKRLGQLEELLDIEYEKLHEFEKAISLADGISQKIALRQQIKRDLTPRLRKLEQEYAELLAGGVRTDEIPEAEAGVLITEVADAVAKIEEKKPADVPQEMLRLLTEIRGKLDEPGKSASAKLKVTLPIIPLISSYEMELDTEGFVTQVWRKARDFFKKVVPRNPR